VDLLLDAFERAAPEVPTARLAVVGGPPEAAAAYARRAAARGLGERVLFTGPRPVAQLGGYLAQATVLVSPRLAGGNTPMKLYSYLDSGRAVLATRLPTHTQVLDDATALLVEPEPAAFAAGLVRLLQDAALRARLAESARELARREHTPEAFRRKLLAFYAAVEDRLRRHERLHEEVPTDGCASDCRG
jgi:glycosyltransferase involved in cell wall biosynthesis